MLDFRQWSRRRWITSSCIALLACGLMGMAAGKAYRHYTLPERIAQGQVLFEHEWTVDDALSDGGDGLGPVFNEKSCVACHFQGGIGGGGPFEKNVTAFEVLPTSAGVEILGGVVHASATQPELLESMLLVSQRHPVIPGGVTVSDGCTTRRIDFNPVVHSSINTPALFGAGLIDELSSWSIRGAGLSRTAQLISENLDGDFTGTSVGRARSLSAGRVGKFGWKGQFASLEEFVATACAVELGLTNPQKSQMAPRAFREDEGAALDMDATQLDQLITYVAALPRPVEVLPQDPAEREKAIEGKKLFAEVGCADCHTPDLGHVQGIYSDFRLYTIEPDHVTGYARVTTPVELPSDHPKANEWKTPPLWGVADSAPYFHDGGSPTLQHAILRHDGQSKRSREAFQSLSPAKRYALLTFLDTLQAPR
ncbi:MAG: thiol oxidoreductase-like protein [Planctomycetota bacterium]|nr:MAG: thiol oxidoreductase-like protein [Planctomycetota bacterium]